MGSSCWASWQGWPELLFLAMGQSNWSFLEAKEFPRFSQLLNIKSSTSELYFLHPLKQKMARPKLLCCELHIFIFTGYCGSYRGQKVNIRSYRGSNLCQFGAGHHCLYSHGFLYLWLLSDSSPRGELCSWWWSHVLRHPLTSCHWQLPSWLFLFF